MGLVCSFLTFGLSYLYVCKYVVAVRCIVGESPPLLPWKARDTYIKLEILLTGDHVTILILLHERHMTEIWLTYLCIPFSSNRTIHIHSYLQKGYMFSIVRVNNTHSSMLVSATTNFCSQQFCFICFFTDNLPGVWPNRLSYPRSDGHKQRILGRQLATLHKRNCVITNRKAETNMCLGSICHSTAQDSYCSHNKEKRTCNVRTWTNKLLHHKM